uniref:NADPH-dependent diflavin oxidoreductase 1 n=1 Tax=Aceria tosichella TaxID=561515 RepID=A0A6G1S830_9ACAR
MMMSHEQESTPHTLRILYGSQTGNAEDMAKRVGLQAKSLGFSVIVETMDDFQLKELPRQHLVIFICSTTGHGQEPENMKNLFNFIRRKDLPKNCLSRVRFTVYGLGDSSYAKFNYVAKILFKRLKEIGAQPIQELVASDEQHRYGCDGAIYPKLDELWLKLNKVVPPTGSHQDCYSYAIGPSTQDNVEKIFDENFRERYNLKEAVCVKNQRVTDPSHFQDTRLLCFKSIQDIHYEPGDVCTIYPQNSTENVQEFIKLLNLDPKQRVKVNKLDPDYMVNYLYDFIPDGTTIEDLVRYYLDIQSVPKRSFFEYLWPFSGDKLERDKLKEFATTEGQEELYDYCIRPKRTILETLMDFPNTIGNIKLESLLDMIPPIKPRSFSIASAASVHPNEIHLIVGVVSYKTNLKKSRKGLCSNYLARLEPVEGIKCISQSSIIRFFIRRTSFKLPQDDKTPIIMVGPGLGIAPFRGFIQERHRRRLNADGVGSFPDTVFNHLYFGCRYQSKDFYFEEELERYSSKSTIRLQVAISREQNKQYVQDLLKADSDLIVRLMRNDNAIFYVAGNSKLPEAIRIALAEMFSQLDRSDESSDYGEKVVAHLEASNRIQYDCW